MAVERDSLSEIEQLTSQAERLRQIGAKIHGYSQSLGTEEGPQRFNYRSLSGEIRSDAMVKTGTIKRELTTKVLPRITEKLTAITDQLEPHIDEMLRGRFRIDEISQLVSGEFLPADALELAQHDMDQFKADLTGKYRRGLITKEEYINEVFHRLTEGQSEPTGLKKPIETSEVQDDHDDEKRRQLNIIRQNLGDAKRFKFPERMEIRKGLFDLNDQASPITVRTANMFWRSGVIFLEELLNMSEEELFRLRNFGPKSLEITLELLLARGILPLEQTEVAGPNDIGEKFDATPTPPVEGSDEPSPEVSTHRTVINRAKREVEIDGRLIKVPSDLTWLSLTTILSGGQEGISSEILGEMVKKVGSKSNKPAASAANNLRSIIGADMITRTGPKQQAIYGYNGEVIYTPSDLLILEGQNVAEVDGRRVELTDQEAKMLAVLSESVGQQISSSELSSKAFGNPNTTETDSAKIYASLARKINYSYGEKLLDNSGRLGPASWYKLQNVLVTVKKPEQPGEKPTVGDSEEVQPGSSSEDELADQPNQTDLSAALLASIQERANKDILTNPDHLDRVLRIAERFGGTINFGQPSETLKTEDVDGSFSQEDRAILARFIEDLNVKAVKLSDEVEFKITLEEGTISGCRRLVEDFYSGQAEQTNGELKELRLAAINKLDRLLKDAQVEGKILEFEGDFGMLLLELRVLDETVTPSYLTEFLATRAKGEEYSDDVVNWVRKLARLHEGEQKMKEAGIMDESPMKFEIVRPEPALAEAKPGAETQPAVEAEQPYVSKVREETFLVVSVLLSSPNGLSIEEVISTMGQRSDGRKFTLVNAINSMVRLAGVLNDRVKKGVASYEEAETLEKIRQVVNKEDEEDIKEIMRAWKEELPKWIKETVEPKSSGVEVTQLADETVEPLTELSSDEVNQEDQDPADEDFETNWNLSGLDDEPETPDSLSEEPVAGKASKSSPRAAQIEISTKGIARYARSKGFRVEGGRSGHLKIVDQNGQYVATLSHSHGRNQLTTGQYTNAIKKIDQRSNSAPKED